ncbi:MAG: hypothetical protein IT258_10640 [Saprospiraceae bacterium]|nr:hypothetical protein [Saprospiraceae bacterium]
MKKHLFLLAFLIPLLPSCCKNEDSTTDCIDLKIEAFKAEPGSSAIYEYDTPDGKQYLFEHGCIDCGDYVYDITCTAVCVTNLEGYDENVQFCSQSFYDSPRKEIWKK